ncbi:hypothetical protein ACHAWU_003443 [Discostella pseudostelligera]|uniref:Uncharacterized protein n=1 Tax=Discostella pseudostelligera TaxID=259834 RepID=A0ABD3MWQ2_9STRA
MFKTTCPYGNLKSTGLFYTGVYGADAQLFTVDGTESAITDYQIEPDAGSVNPYQQQDASPGGAWAVTLSNEAATSATNLLPLAPATAVTPLLPGTSATTVYIMIRAYLPADGFSALRPQLPEVTITERDGISRTMYPCTAKQRKNLAALKEVKSLKAALETTPLAAASACGSLCTAGGERCTCPPDLQFFKAGSVATPFPNADSAYVGALYTPQKGKVVVMRALMPTTSSGTSPQSISDIKRQSSIGEDYVDTMLANWKLWVPATAVNIAFCPPILRVLFLNVVFFFWSIFLSLKLNKSED